MTAAPGALARWHSEVAVDPELAHAWTLLRHAAAWEQSGIEAQRQGFSAESVESDFQRARALLAELGVPASLLAPSRKAADPALPVRPNRRARARVPR
jgi:hypothetical protein